ncbi:fatty-acid amide hydrolase [Saitoella complicata NRRL Y-17804]|uniref:amidase n=1 Tax=Saitoella complicata (strain BCRC 22490 / CBS 7301 / JCM 7358 / NBRC 10748 / NRRL Y-17804) TaxID=698492 RepID=A0A0E9NJT5_SAICN|nr:fatty-acid amide hydrolase [Saitoella complicata NRRL Y-17804]ODQ54564.1 fatty-acid amide hydrolase [Saitoella complicata NRRL Y-17804]GAO50068.1 hypothetical protein G7K_4203-t1 [Saitoella complicata NRRL Y-17804]
MTRFPSSQPLLTQKRLAQLSQIPPDWLLPQSSLPLPFDFTDVTHDHSAVADFTSTPAWDVRRFFEKCGLLTEKECEIVSVDAFVALENMRNGDWTAVEVTTAYCKSAAVAQQTTTCLTEIFFDRALSRAHDLDDHFRRTGKTMGPLHGLPISLKDQFNITGIDTTMGYVKWIGQIASQNSTLVDILLESGAVLYVKTNVPQTLMFGETVNNIFGRTLNPLNTSLSPGGSSGGEAALLAAHGSPLGVGTDIGGSIRVPSGFCGLYGLKPSHGRIPYYGAANSCMGQESVPSVAGPMARSLRDLKLFLRAVCGAMPWRRDPQCVELAFRDFVIPRRLRIGVLSTNSIEPPSPEVRAAMSRLVASLRHAGHEIVEWSPPPHLSGLEIVCKMYTADAGEDIRASLHPEDIVPGIHGHHPSPKRTSVYELWQLHRQRDEYAHRYLGYWNEMGVDCVLSPVTSHTAMKHGHSGAEGTASYTAIFNLLGYASCCFPVRTVGEGGREGTVGVECVGRRFAEEWVLGCVERIEEAMSLKVGEGVDRVDERMDA